ncbi:MAG: RIP metalloprotease RseP [Lachnospiraceae bacterium]|nr:RIP metalloprotease RseP [Lachnospiraceae bacterium]
MEIWSRVISILLFLLIFCVVVVSHEFGHFLIAKANGIKVVEFYIGFGPKLIHWKKNGTEYSIRLLPLGGACVFEGMDAASMAEESEKKKLKDKAEAGFIEEDEGSDEVVETEESSAKDDSGSFIKASVWSRFATVVAGPLFNIILGFIIAFIMVCNVAIRDPIATEVIPGGAAEAAGIEAGDRMISLNGQKVCLYEDIVLFNALYTGGEVEVVYERNGEQFTTVLVPQYDETEQRYLIGISNGTFIEIHGLQYIKYTWYEMRYNLKATYGSLWKLIRGKVKSTEIAGPVGVANVVSETYESTKEYGAGTVAVNMLNIALMLTVNLGILNLLPIPALDGGRLIFIILEMLRGKPVPPDKEAIVHFVGVIFFLILIVFIFFNDIRNVFFIK